MVLKYVKPGEKFKVAASTFNSFVDAARDFQNRKFGEPRFTSKLPYPDGLVLVKNNTKERVFSRNILGIDSPVFLPVEYEDSFQSTLVLNCVKPLQGTHDNKFVILAEPILPGEIGRAYIDGVCAVKIAGAGDTAGITNNDPSKLTAGGVGATVLWWDETTKWGIVRIGGKSNTGLYKITGGPANIGGTYLYGGYKQKWNGSALENDGTVLYLYFPNNTGELPESEVYGHYHEGLDLGWTITAAGVAYPVIICTGHLGQSDFVPPPEAPA